MKPNFTFIAIFVVTLLSTIQLTGYAQQAKAPQVVNFNYDAAGNRILRYYSAARLRNTTDAKDEMAEQIAEQNGILVYPNPVQDNYVNVSLASLKSEEPSTIYVLDNMGKTVVAQKTSTAVTQIDLSAYTAGVYYVKVMAGKEELFYKIMKGK